LYWERVRLFFKVFLEGNGEFEVRGRSVYSLVCKENLYDYFPLFCDFETICMLDWGFYGISYTCLKLVVEKVKGKGFEGS